VAHRLVALANRDTPGLPPLTVQLEGELTVGEFRVAAFALQGMRRAVEPPGRVEARPLYHATGCQPLEGILRDRRLRPAGPGVPGHCEDAVLGWERWYPALTSQYQAGVVVTARARGSFDRYGTVQRRESPHAEDWRRTWCATVGHHLRWRGPRASAGILYANQDSVEVEGFLIVGEEGLDALTRWTAQAEALGP
jgi:hypothetical protein